MELPCDFAVLPLGISLREIETCGHKNLNVNVQSSNIHNSSNDHWVINEEIKCAAPGKWGVTPQYKGIKY